MTSPDLAPITVHGVEYADLGYCRTPHGDLNADGPVIHTIYCPRGDAWGDSAVSGSSCIRPGQDGAAIKRARDEAADTLRFTPPIYRKPTARRRPGPAISFAREQVTEVVALRGRPRTTATETPAEWTTWETYTQTHPDHVGSPAAFLHRIPRDMTPDQAAQIVAEFEAKVPHYEFTVVRARLRLDEERLA